MPGPPTLEERLNAVTGLPQRRPGAQTPILGLPIPDEPTPADEAESAGEPAPGPVPVQGRAAPVEAVTPDAPGVLEPEEPPAPMRTASSFDLGPGAPASPLVYSEAGSDTPIFKALRSAWLSSHATDDAWRSSEVEAGWAQADRVAESVTEAPVNEVGLPVRRPGSSLVPGGVAKPATAGARDPEAIRARLSAHASGVSRGRATAATATPTPEQQQSEESPR
jgi:hypothetical protein